MTYYLDFTNLDGMTEPLTNKDLAEGKRGDCALCPVALGVARMFDAGEETGCYVHVSLETAVIHEHGGDVVVDLRLFQRLCDWIFAFDNREQMKPIMLCVYTWRFKGFDYMLDMTDADAEALEAVTK